MKRVPRRKVSPFDPRPPATLRRGGMVGGDRMTDHGYAADYATALRGIGVDCSAETLCRAEDRYSIGAEWARQVASGPAVTLVEMGILQGVGLAMWCDVLPAGSSVIGLDVDLSHYTEFLPTLIERGAFDRMAPEVAEVDELAPDAGAQIGRLLAGRRIDIFVDDALHDSASILQAMAKVMPLMADRFVYFVEDNGTVHAEIARRYPRLAVAARGLLTAVAP